MKRSRAKSIRKAKKLLKLYPPIIELGVPESLLTSRFFERTREAINEKGGLYASSLVYIFPIKEVHPQGVLTVKTEMSEERLEAFKKAWMEEMSKPHKQPIEFRSFEETSFINTFNSRFYIKIHSPLKGNGFQDFEQKLKEEMQKLSESIDFED